MAGTLQRRLMVAAFAAVVVGCSSADDAAPTSDSISDDSTPVVTGDDFTRTSDEMRTVPTLPPSTIEGQTGDDGDGVIVVAPTIVAPRPSAVDPDRPATSVAPPTTDLVGDPQPSPDSTQPPPPPTVTAPPDACDRLEDYEVASIVAERGGAAAQVTSVDESTCRIVSGDVLVEVAFIPVEDVRNDWYRREGIEPVGEVGGDAVGLPTFVTPSGDTGAGYTIAVAGSAQGVVVSARAPSDARLLAADVAIFADQAA